MCCWKAIKYVLLYLIDIWSDFHYPPIIPFQFLIHSGKIHIEFNKKYVVMKYKYEIAA